MKILHMMLGIMVLLGLASAGHFTIGLDVDTYLDSANPIEVHSDEDILWATSSGGKPSKEVYLGFINAFGTAGTFSPDDVKSATLKVHVAEVERAGEVAVHFLHGTTLETMTWVDRPEYDENASATIDASREGDYRVDATNIVKKAIEICAEGCPFSIVLVAGGDASIGFSSSNDSSNMAELSYETFE